jgi:hypothetical protein
MDPRPDEGALETSDRRDVTFGRLSAELESDQAGAPGGMLALQVAGDPEQFLDPGADRTTAGSIVGSEALAVESAGSPADVSDGAIGDRQLGGDPGQGVALPMASHDLLTKRDGERTRHGSRLRGLKKGHQLLTNADVTHAES